MELSEPNIDLLLPQSTAKEETRKVKLFSISVNSLNLSSVTHVGSCFKSQRKLTLWRAKKASCVSLKALHPKRQGGTVAIDSSNPKCEL